MDSDVSVTGRKQKTRNYAIVAATLILVVVISAPMWWMPNLTIEQYRQSTHNNFLSYASRQSNEVVTIMFMFGVGVTCSTALSLGLISQSHRIVVTIIICIGLIDIPLRYLTSPNATDITWRFYIQNASLLAQSLCHIWAIVYGFKIARTGLALAKDRASYIKHVACIVWGVIFLCAAVSRSVNLFWEIAEINTQVVWELDDVNGSLIESSENYNQTLQSASETNPLLISLLIETMNVNATGPVGRSLLLKEVGLIRTVQWTSGAASFFGVFAGSWCIMFGIMSTPMMNIRSDKVCLAAILWICIISDCVVYIILQNKGIEHWKHGEGVKNSEVAIPDIDWLSDTKRAISIYLILHFATMLAGMISFGQLTARIVDNVGDDTSEEGDSLANLSREDNNTRENSNSTDNQINLMNFISNRGTTAEHRETGVP